VGEPVPGVGGELVRPVIERPDTVAERELGRIRAGLPAVAGQQRSARLPSDPLGLALQLVAEFRMTVAIVGQADGQPRALLVQRAGDPAALGRDRAKLLLIEVAELRVRLIPRLEQPASVVRVDQPLPRLPRIRQLGDWSRVLTRAPIRGLVVADASRERARLRLRAWVDAASRASSQLPKTWPMTLADGHSPGFSRLSALPPRRWACVRDQS
jgi:hypothetical protein